MTEIELQEIEIVGFNGSPQVECGCAQPIARRKSDGMHCVLKLPLDSRVAAWCNEEEAAQYASEKRWTLFSSPVFLPQGCLVGTEQSATTQPMVVFVDDSVLDTADRLPRPSLASGQYLIWRALQGYAGTLHATCSTSRTVETLLDEWAAALLGRYDGMYATGRELPYLKHIADFALCAARGRSLRWKAYLRFALAQEKDKVRRTFDTFVHHEFPETSWEDFVTELRSLGDVLGIAVSRPPRPSDAACVQGGNALPKVRNITAAKPVKINGFSPA